MLHVRPLHRHLTPPLFIHNTKKYFHFVCVQNIRCIIIGGRTEEGKRFVGANNALCKQTKNLQEEIFDDRPCNIFSRLKLIPVINSVCVYVCLC